MRQIGKIGKAGRGGGNGQSNFKIPRAGNWRDMQIAKPIIATIWKTGRSSRGAPGRPSPFLSNLRLYLLYHFTEFSAIY